MELRIYGTHFVWNNGDTEPRRDGVTEIRIVTPLIRESMNPEIHRKALVVQICSKLSVLGLKKNNIRKEMQLE